MKIGFIGCGNMGSAMISGMLKKGLYKEDEIIVSNLTEEGSKRSKEKLGVVTTLDNCEVVKNTKLVFLAVKPQFYEEVLNEVKGESDTRTHSRRYCTGENSCLVRGKMWTTSESSKNDAKHSCPGWRGYDRCMR